MKPQKIESRKFPKSNGYYVLYAIGQAPACSSDKVIVCGKIYLPAKEDQTLQLSDHVMFGDRVFIGGTSTVKYWGNDNREDRNYRTIGKNFIETTWKEAFSLAEKYCEIELEKLEQAIINREQALIDADKD